MPCIFFILLQGIRIVDSSLALQRQHLLVISHPLLIRTSMVRIVPHVASQAKNQTLVVAQVSQISFTVNRLDSHHVRSY